MKKVITIIMIICIILSGCGKEELNEDLKPTETSTPTQEITPTVEVTLEPTEESTPTKEILTAETTCVMCGRITKCTALIDKVWNSDLKMAIDKAYYLCDSCYPIAEANQKDVNTYYEIWTALDLFFSSEDTLSNPDIQKAFYTTKREADGNYYMYYEPGIITIDSNGVHLSFAKAKGEEKIKLGLNQYLGKGYYTNYKTESEYEIQVIYNTKTCKYEISTTSSPTDILLKLD